MHEDFDNLQLWHAPEVRLRNIVVDRGLAVRLTYTPLRSNEPVEARGHLRHGPNQSLELVVTEAEMSMPFGDAEALSPMHPCQVSFCIEYGMLPEDDIMPAEYSAKGEIERVERDDCGNPVCFAIRLGHRFSHRKTRRFRRELWNPAQDSLVRLLIVHDTPAAHGELTALLHAALHEKDKSQDMVDLSAGGARIAVETQLAVRPLSMNERYLMLLLPHKEDRAMLPHVLLARKVAVEQDSEDSNRSTLRLHFVAELDWKASNRTQLSWQDIGESGSPRLQARLQPGG